MENSSGGTIYETVDALLSNEYNVGITEIALLHVKLALLGRKGEDIKRIYSHFAPLKHCRKWLSKTFDPLPDVIPTTSTAVAAKLAQEHSNTAAIGSERLARIYGLDVLEYPLEQNAVNITEFLVITNKSELEQKDRPFDRISLAVDLNNGPGSLYDFLSPLKKYNLNLSRIISRPFPSKPQEYLFYIDIAAKKADQKNIHAALNEAAKHCVSLKNIGASRIAGPY